MNFDPIRLLEVWQTITIQASNGRQRDVDAKVLQRFVSKVSVSPDDCWHWIGTMTPEGYGTFKIRGAQYGAHRFSYMAFVSQVPEGTQVDHLCHTAAIERGACSGGRTCLHRRCVNPDHLRVITPRENVLSSLAFTAVHAKRTHCVNGHLLEGANLYVRKSGGRACYECHRIADRRKRREQAQQEGRMVLPLPAERTHCVNGHPFDEDNTKTNKHGWRACRQCANERSRAYKARRKARRED